MLVMLFVVGGSDTTETVKNVSVAPSSSPAVEQTSTPSVEKSEAATEVEIYVPGTVVETDTLRITYISCDDFESDNMFMQPKEGNKFKKATFEFENIGSSDEFISSWDFNCYADGYTVEQSYASDDDLSATISAGKKTKGSVTFEIPINSKEIELEYVVNSWTEEKITFSVTN